MRKIALTLTAAAFVLRNFCNRGQRPDPFAGRGGFSCANEERYADCHAGSFNGRTGGHGCGAGFIWNGARCVPC